MACRAADVDDMIEQLFPGQSARTVEPHSKTPSDWDAPSPPKHSDGGATAACVAQHATSSYDDDDGAVTVATNLQSLTSAAAANRNSFDDSDDDIDGTHHRGHKLHTVPFPCYAPGQIVGSCHDSCVLSRVSNAQLYHPTLESLKSGDAADLSTPTSEAMKRKGAFHAYAGVHVGNGVGGDGCMHLVCRRCDHPVVRLAAASWNDSDGARDLYLALRNYYPDWQRLALQRSAGGIDGPLLTADKDAAAYCCQCSWATAHAEVCRVQTTAMDLAVFSKTHERDATKVHCPFATHLPQQESNGKRPPLWSCRGHCVS